MAGGGKRQERAGSQRKVGQGIYLNSTIDAGKLLGAKIDASKLLGPKLDVSKLVEANIEAGKLLGAKIEAGKLLGPKLDAGKLVAPKIEAGQLVGPKIDVSKLVGPKLDVSNLVGAKIDASKLIGPKLSLDNLIGATLRESHFSDGLIAAGAVATRSAIPDVDIPELVGGMSIGEFLGSRIDVSALVSADVAVTDLLGDRLEAAALLGDPFEPDNLDEITLESLDTDTSALAKAVLLRVDELEAEIVGRLDHIESPQTLRRQLVLLVLGAVLGLLLTVAVAQMAPQLIDPGTGQNAVTQSITSNASNIPGSPRAVGHRDLDGVRLKQIEHINFYLQDRLRSGRLAEVRAVDAARWLGEAGVLSDSASRPGLPLRKLLRAGVITGAEQRPDRPHGRWFIMRT